MRIEPTRYLLVAAMGEEVSHLVSYFEKSSDYVNFPIAVELQKINIDMQAWKNRNGRAI